MKNKKFLLPLSIFVLAIASYMLMQGPKMSIFKDKIALTQQPAMQKDSAVYQKKTQPGIAMPETENAGEASIISGSRMPNPIYNNNALEVDNRVYEKRAYHYVLVKDVASYLNQIKEYALSIDGRVLASNVSSSQNYDSGYLTIKVPVAKFEEAASRVTNEVKKVLQEQITAYDTTGALVGRNEQLAKLQDQKIQKEIELDEAKTELEKRRIQLAIDRLIKQIEQVEKQVKNQEVKIEYATLEISATNQESYYHGGSPNPWQELQRAWRSMKGVLMGLLAIGAWVAVYSLIWLPIVLIVKWIVKKVKKKVDW